ncbi:hypothetical protein [Rhizobium ruizarguesonis]|jgi:hypothetical protein|uniref:hypothetical protein n=1 Tax=Rhizobium ruizarguesonis TaxID=2081791 RepID=UPI00102FE290|nr:hypothetical protein [Rhizobium ruizarguesonis]TBC01900.1 hypothetical protein ELH34_37340 [Rhizobium ruizarguesonis]
MTPTIQSIEAVERPPSPGAGRTIAKFSVQLGDVRINGLLLREYSDGTRRTVSGNIGGHHAVTFRPEIAEKITAAASIALQGGQLAQNSSHHKD